MNDPRITVIGAGIGGLVAALLLLSKGCTVTIFEAHASPGGKMREVKVAGAAMDAGPTVFTMRHVFEAIFHEAGENLTDHVSLQPTTILARHQWEQQPQLDLFASLEQSADAIARFATPDEGRRYFAFCREARAIHDTLEQNFMRVERPSQFELLRRAGLGPMLRTKPFSSMWSALSGHFKDPRLRQLFGRYATYCGSSPFLSPATLMLIAHVEQQGVWLVEGGMHRFAQALASLVIARGGIIRYNEPVSRILTEGGRASGVMLADGSCIESDAVVMNGDCHALALGLLGRDSQSSVPPTSVNARSLSAVTWNMLARTDGLTLSRHNVFFAKESRAEFSALFDRRSMPEDPTVYICAQDRDDLGKRKSDGAERLLVLINAPANADVDSYDPREIERCQKIILHKLARCGLTISDHMAPPVITSPQGFSKLFPATYGALYGRATHGAMASFARPGSRSKLEGLYLTGGSVHPGAGVPMVALSGQIAANSLMQDWTLRRGFRPAVTAGGMSMR
jgi:1-hydroxycarotenoid 3,4-desaturase